MTTFAERQAEDRRGILLRAMAEMPDYRLAAPSLQRVLEHYGHRVGGDVVRADLQDLERFRLISIEKVNDNGRVVWIACLSESGQDVAEGRQVHDQVTRHRAG